MHRNSRREFLKLGSATVAATALSGQAARAIQPVERKGAPRMKVSCAAYSYRQFLSGNNRTMTMEDFIDRCAAMGCDGTELTSYYFPQEVTDVYISRLKRRCFLLGLDVSSTAVGNNFCLPPGDRRNEQIGHTKKWTDIAQKLGAPAIRIFAGGAPAGVSIEQARAWCVECIEECCDYAGKRGVFLALENHGGIVATADQLLEVVRAIKSEWCAVNLDTGNFRSADPYADLAKCAPYAVTVQVKTEISPQGGQRQDADLKRIADIMRSVNYRGYLVLEYEAREDPMTAVPRHIQTLKELTIED